MDQKMILNECRRQEATETGENQVFFCLGKGIKVGGKGMRRGCLMVFFLTTFYVTVLSVSLLLTTQSLHLIDLMVDSMFTTKMSC